MVVLWVQSCSSVWFWQDAVRKFLLTRGRISSSMLKLCSVVWGSSSDSLPFASRTEEVCNLRWKLHSSLVPVLVQSLTELLRNDSYCLHSRTAAVAAGPALRTGFDHSNYSSVLVRVKDYLLHFAKIPHSLDDVISHEGCFRKLLVEASWQTLLDW